MDAPTARVTTDATDERSCLTVGRDAVGQVVGCVQQRLSHHRATGQFAVTFGWPVLRRRLVAQVDAALGRSDGDAKEPRTATEAVGTPWPTRETSLIDEPAPEGSSVPRLDVELGSAERLVSLGTPGTPGTPGAPHTANGHESPKATELAVPGYDSLSASQVVERLAGLPSGDLDEVREYEAAHRNRRTILGKIDQIQSAN